MIKCNGFYPPPKYEIQSERTVKHTVVAEALVFYPHCLTVNLDGSARTYVSVNQGRFSVKIFTCRRRPVPI